MMAEELIFKIDLQGSEESLQELARIKGETILLGKAYSDLNKELSSGKITMDQYAKSAAELDAKKGRLKDSSAAISKSLKQEQDAYKGAEGSMVRISNELGIMRDRYRNLSAAERENVEIGGKLRTEIQAHDEKIKSLDASIGNHQRNVGNYQSVWGGLGNTLRNNIPGMQVLGGAIDTVTNSMGAVTGATGKSSSGMMMLGGAIGIGIAAFGGLLSASKDIINSSGDLSDSWEEMTTSMEFGWKSLTATIASGDFSNLFTNMERAIKAGKEYAKTLDELEDRTRSISMREKDNTLQVDKLRLSLKNVNLTSDERKKIAQQIDDLEKGIMKEKQISAQKDLDNELKKIEAIHGVSGAIVLQYTKNKIAYKEQIDRAEEYISLQKQLYVTTIDFNGRATTSIDQNVKQQLQSFTKQEIAFANVVQKVGKVSDESIDAVVSKYGALSDVTHEYNVAVEKVLTTENRLEKQQGKTLDAGISKAEKLAQEKEAALKKQSEDEGKLYEAAIKEQAALDAKVEKLKIDLGLATQDELLRITMERVTKSKEFELLTAEQQAKAVSIIYQEALKVSAKGISNNEEWSPDFISQTGTPNVSDISGGGQSGSLSDRLIGGMLSGIGVSGTDEQMQSYVSSVKSQIGQLVSDVTNMWINGQQQRIQQELKAETAKVDQQAKSELKALDAKRKKGLITEAQYEKQKEKIDQDAAEKKDKLNREAFEKDKKIKMLSAIMAGALAVVQMLANPGGIAGVVLAALAALTAVVQIATIANTKYEGARGGLLHGPAHRDGGIKYDMGGDVLELEGGEAVLNKRSMASNDVLNLSGTPRQIASDINSYRGYGVKFAAGGYTPAPTPRSSSVSVNRSSVDQAVDDRLAALKVYVVESDISDTQRRANKIKVESQW